MYITTALNQKPGFFLFYSGQNHKEPIQSEEVHPLMSHRKKYLTMEEFLKIQSHFKLR